MPTIFESPAELLTKVGEHLGTSDWLAIEQDRINQFADATGDHQWIHVDPEKAKDGPFGATIAHGYLTMSLVNLFLPQIVEVRGISMGINYGANRLRFPSPVPVGSRLRSREELLEVEQVGEDALQIVYRTTVDIEGTAKPACVVERVVRLYFD